MGYRLAIKTIFL